MENYSQNLWKTREKSCQRPAPLGPVRLSGMGAPVAEADVVIEDGLIAEVGVGLDGDEQVDVSGSTLLPGLFDTHVHVMFGHIDMWQHPQTPFSYKFSLC